jgi:peptidyl-dipeptidase Dcp
MNAIASTDLFEPVEGSLQSASFSHIFSGGYDAGYYSYKWAEVLDADAFSVFQERGIFDRQTADSFRKNILEKGGSEHPMKLYKAFRGQEPTVTALLKRNGLL